MYIIGEKIALNNGFQGLVTSESIGQVASQTLDNLVFLSSLIKIPIFRPLIGFDKEEIMEIARRIEVYSIAAKNVGKCLLQPSKPATKISRLNIIEKILDYTQHYGEKYEKYLEIKYV